jgi:hypothetical protein
MFKDGDLTRPASRKAVGEMLQAYADEARKNTTGARLLGEPLKAEEVLVPRYGAPAARIWRRLSLSAARPKQPNRL